MINITLNGTLKKVHPSTSLMELVQSLALAPNEIVIEYNAQITAKNQWKTQIIQPNAVIEILHFMGGGSSFRPTD